MLCERFSYRSTDSHYTATLGQDNERRLVAAHLLDIPANPDMNVERRRDTPDSGHTHGTLTVVKEPVEVGFVG